MIKLNQYFTCETKEIDICDVDYMGDYQLPSLFSCLSKLATKNAIQLGYYKEDMYPQYGWVVAKQSLHLHQPIHYQDTIELSTIIGEGRFVTFPRYYYIKKEDQIIGYCSSIWTLIDIQKRRLISPQKVGIIVPQIKHLYHLDEPQSIIIDVDMHYHSTRQVLYSDVDINQHMNNTRYLQWAFDIIDFNIYQTHFISDLNILYKQEIKPLQHIDLYIGHSQNKYLIEGRKDKTTYFLIEIYFHQREDISLHNTFQ